MPSYNLTAKGVYFDTDTQMSWRVKDSSGAYTSVSTTFVDEETLTFDIPTFLEVAEIKARDNSLSFFTDYFATTPPALTAQAQGSSVVLQIVNSYGDLDWFGIYRSTSSDPGPSNDELIAVVGGDDGQNANPRIYTDAAVLPATTYHYRARGFSGFDYQYGPNLLGEFSPDVTVTTN